MVPPKSDASRSRCPGVEQDFNGEFLPDRAETRAREWCVKHGPFQNALMQEAIPSLAALLREERQAGESDAAYRWRGEDLGEHKRLVLAEVRRVVEDEWEKTTYDDALSLSLISPMYKAILARLEKLA